MWLNPTHKHKPCFLMPGTIYPLSTYCMYHVMFIVRTFLKRKWRFSWDGVWTLVILQYSHVVYTSLSILNCPTIPVYQGDGSGVSVVLYLTMDVASYQ